MNLRARFVVVPDPRWLFHPSCGVIYYARHPLNTCAWILLLHPRYYTHAGVQLLCLNSCTLQGLVRLHPRYYTHAGVQFLRFTSCTLHGVVVLHPRSSHMPGYNFCALIVVPFMAGGQMRYTIHGVPAPYPNAHGHAPGMEPTAIRARL